MTTPYVSRAKFDPSRTSKSHSDFSEASSSSDDLPSGTYAPVNCSPLFPPLTLRDHLIAINNPPGRMRKTMRMENKMRQNELDDNHFHLFETIDLGRPPSPADSWEKVTSSNNSSFVDLSELTADGPTESARNGTGIFETVKDKINNWIQHQAMPAAASTPSSPRPAVIDTKWFLATEQATIPLDTLSGTGIDYASRLCNISMEKYHLCRHLSIVGYSNSSIYARHSQYCKDRGIEKCTAKQKRIVRQTLDSKCEECIRRTKEEEDKAKSGTGLGSDSEGSFTLPQTVVSCVSLCELVTEEY